MYWGVQRWNTTTLVVAAAVALAVVVAVKSMLRDGFVGLDGAEYVPETCRARCSMCQMCRANAPLAPDPEPQSEQGLPPPSAVDGRCTTHMGDDPDDDGSCLALVYHECPQYGRTDESLIPARIRDMKRSAMQQIYDVNEGCTSVKGAGNTPVARYKCFTRPPRTWASVCVARPEKAGRGKCKSMTPDDWRVFVQGEDPLRTITCAGKDTPASLYLKSHFRGQRIDEEKTGQVGRA